MNHSRLYIFISVVCVIASVAIVVAKKLPQEELQLLMTQGVFPKSLLPKPAPVRRDPAAQPKESTELTAVESKAHNWEELLTIVEAIPRLSEIPWQRTEVERLLSSNPSASCRLLIPDQEVSPAPVAVGTSESAMSSARRTAFVVGLQVDPAARRTLPSLSKSTIEDYLAKHVLAIQATIFRSKEGEVTFGGPVEAAFVARSSPMKTAAPEPMISEAVGNIKLLGALQDPRNPQHGAIRTIVLAFNYDRQIAAGTTSTNSTVADYELIFLHLTSDPLTGAIRLVTFATTDGRETFQELEGEGGELLGSLTPDVMASIRFENFKLMGIYPSSPIVTGVKNRVRFSCPVSYIRSRLGEKGPTGGIQFQELLDELHESRPKL